jgi:hypothetical protein
MGVLVCINSGNSALNQEAFTKYKCLLAQHEQESLVREAWQVLWEL